MSFDAYFDSLQHKLDNIYKEIQELHARMDAMTHESKVDPNQNVLDLPTPNPIPDVPPPDASIFSTQANPSVPEWMTAESQISQEEPIQEPAQGSAPWEQEPVPTSNKTSTTPWEDHRPTTPVPEPIPEPAPDPIQSAPVEPGHAGLIKLMALVARTRGSHEAVTDYLKEKGWKRALDVPFDQIDAVRNDLQQMLNGGDHA